MTNTSKEDLKREKRIRRAERGLKITIVLGVASSLYIYKKGYKHGYSDGVNAGYVKAGHEIVESWRSHAEEMRLAREARR